MGFVYTFFGGLFSGVKNVVEGEVNGELASLDKKWRDCGSFFRRSAVDGNEDISSPGCLEQYNSDCNFTIRLKLKLILKVKS